MSKRQRNKIKKIKEKYADQDEEEREMRLALLGAKEVKGFDINKHQERKHKFTKKDEQTQEDEEDSGSEKEEEGEEGNEGEEQN